MHTTDIHTAQALLHGTGLSISDSARLILEAMEESDDLLHETGREKKIRLIRRILHEGVKAVKEETKTVPLAEAMRLSLKAREMRRSTTRRDLRHFTRRMLRVAGAADMPLRKMTQDACRHILGKAFNNSMHSYRKGRAILHSIFAYGMKQGWCTSNPVSQIDTPELQEKEILPLPLQKVRQLEKTARQPEHQAMRLSLHLLTYCGLRPAEVARLKPEDIRWEEKTVIIRPSTSKTGGGRVVPLRLAQKLRGASRTIPRNWLKRWHDLRRAAGFICWQADALRHTFASYHAAYFRNLPELQLEMGHCSLGLLRSRYVNTRRIKPREAELFWQEKTS